MVGFLDVGCATLESVKSFARSVAGRFPGSPVGLGGVALLVLVGMRGLVYRVRLQFGDVAGSLLDDRPTQVIFYAVYVLVIAMAARSWRQLRNRNLLPLLGLAMILLASTAWSIEWGRTFNQSLLMLLNTIATALVAIRLRPLEVVVASVAATQIALWWSVFAVWRKWDFSTDRRGHLAGIFYNRNSLGLVAAFGFVSAVALVWLLRRSAAGVVGSVAAALVAALVWRRTNAATPLVAALSALGVSCWMIWDNWAMVRHRTAAWAARFVVLTAVVAGLIFRGTMADWFGRDSTFTGRTSTWHLVIDTWDRRPVQGFGFFAGWFDERLRRGLVGIGFNHWEAHNGYLEVLLGAGLLGAAMLAWFLIELVRGVWLHRFGDSGPWFAGLLVFVLVMNVGETAIGANRLVWTMAVALFVATRSPRVERVAD